MSTFIEYRFRVHDGLAANIAAFHAATGGAALTVTSVRGDTLPYLVGSPKGDGASIDPNTGTVKAAVYTGQIADAVTATSPSVLRVFTSQLEDTSHRQQLGNRLAAFDFRSNGGAWSTLTVGLLTKFSLSSDITWDVTISDPTQAEHGRQTFTPQIDPATGRLETVAQFVARWPNRGCIFGGPVRGGFLNQPDRGGWEMVVDSNIGSETYLRFVAGYAAPNFKRSLSAEECATAANQKTDSLMRPGGEYIDLIQSFEDASVSNWPDVLIELAGYGFYQPVTGLNYGAPGLGNIAGDEWKHLVKDIRYRGVYIRTAPLGTGGAPAIQTPVRVRAFTAHASDISPIYWTGHPVDLIAKLWTEAGIVYDSGSIETVRGIIGSDRRISLRIAAAQDMGNVLEQAAYGPFGIGARLNASGALEVFNSRIFRNAPPTITIDNTKVQRGRTTPFELDTSTAIRSVTLEHDRLVLTQNSQDASSVDGFTIQHETIERINDDAGALGTDGITYSIPGMIHLADNYDPNLASMVEMVAAEIFDRTGRGLVTGETTTIRGLDTDALQLGDECLVNLKQTPNHNQRLGDNNAVAARAMQVVRRTALTSGFELSLSDSGPNAQPFATVPVLTLAASSDFPRRVAMVTVTNAATLNAAGAAVRVRLATGTSPAGTAYADALYFPAGRIPTTAVALPAVASGSTVNAIARAEVVGSRPSNYSSPVALALAAIPAPTSVTAAPDLSDASRCTVSWAPGSTERGVQTDVLLRLASESPSAAVRRQSLEPGSTTYTLENLVASTAYVAGVEHRETATGDVSALVEVAFTTASSLATLDVPTDATGFSGSQDARDGFAQLDGVYGLAVAATEFPSHVEFVEEVETAFASGIFGSPTTVGRVGAVQGNWTLWQSVAPNDRLRRQLAARQVRDGASPSAYTDGVLVTPWTSQALGLFKQTVGATGILRISQTISPDHKSAIVTIVAGAQVESVHLHYRTVPEDEQGDATNFSGEEDVTASPTLLILRPDTDHTVQFSLPLPLRNFKIAGRAVPMSRTLRDDESVPFYVSAAPPALNAAIRATRTNDRVSLAVDVAWGPSDADPAIGAFVQVVQDTFTTSTNLVLRNILAPGTLNSGTDAALGNIQLPGGKDFLTFRVIITDVNGQAWPLAVIHVARDPLSEATATLLNYRAQPAAVIVFGPDTDTIRITSHDGVTTTIATSGQTSPILYTVGSTIRDNSSTETPLTVDETRSGLKVEAQGGGTWTTILGPVDLHGMPKNPPTALVTATPNANGDAEDVTITPNTATTEQLHVYFRDGSTDSALQWFACVSAGDPTKLSVTAGTVIGPANFFMRVDGVGSPTAKLSALPAAVDQLSRYGVMIEGAESGIQSPWLPVTISLMAKPWNQSLDAVFLESTGNLHVVLVTGPRCLFEEVDIADNAAFTSPTTQTVVASGTPGQQIAFDFALGLAQHGKKFYVRAKPNNKTTGLGLDGDYQVATVDVGALFDCQPSYSETVTTGTVTLVVTDPSGVLNTAAVDGGITAAISWHVTKLGVTTTEASTTVPGGGATTGTYTKAIALDPLHTLQVLAFAHLKDGSTAPLGTWLFDSNKISDLANSDSAVSGTGGANEDFTLQWDTDTRIGANCARYSLDGGSTWTTVTVTSGLLSQFSVTRTTSVQSMLVQAQNAIDSNWGNQSTLKVSVFSSAGPVYSVQLLANNPDSTHDKIFWSCASGVALLSIDGGSFSTPSSSPITVSKPVTGRHTYVFQFSNGGISVTDEVDVLPVSADTITPNLDAALGTPTSTTLPVTVTASNPVSGGSTPGITVKCVGCTMTISGSTYSDGTTVTISSGTVVTGNRSSTTTATMAQLEIVGSLGSATERIVVAIPPQTAFGPTLTVNATPGSSSYSLTWSGTGTITVSIDGGSFGTPSASPITVTRTSSDHTYTFSATADGQTIQQTVVIPALGSTGGGSGTFTSLSTSVHSTGSGTSSIHVTWSFSASASFDVYTNDPGYTGDPSGNTYAVAPGGSGVSSGFNAPVTENLSPNPLGTNGPIDIGFYVLAYSGVSETGRSTKTVNTYQTDV